MSKENEVAVLEAMLTAEDSIPEDVGAYWDLLTWWKIGTDLFVAHYVIELWLFLKLS